MGGKVRAHGEKWIPGEVSNYQKQKETHYRAQFDLSNGVDGSLN